MTVKLKPSIINLDELAYSLERQCLKLFGAKFEDAGKAMVLYSQSATMLRQQAQEIADLKTNISEHQQEIKQLREALEDCTCQGGHSEAYLKAKGRL
jgi:predicted RNase H-like nuclease (RuvC/YqgF family)